MTSPLPDPAPSSIPAALDALMAALATRPALAGLQIVDGADVVALEDEHLIVGLPSPDTAAAAVQANAQIGAQRREETYEIKCALAAGTGETAPGASRAARTRAFALLHEVARQLRPLTGDPTLGGAVRFAELTDIDYAVGLVPLEAGGDALFASIAFTVRCQQRV